MRLNLLKSIKTAAPLEGVFSTHFKRDTGLCPTQGWKNFSGPLTPVSLRQLRNFQPYINFRGSAGMIKTQSWFVFQFCQLSEATQECAVLGTSQETDWGQGDPWQTRLTAATIAQEQDTRIKSYFMRSLPIRWGRLGSHPVQATRAEPILVRGSGLMQYNIGYRRSKHCLLTDSYLMDQWNYFTNFTSFQISLWDT